ncbi:MAG: hypothetical protein Q7U54_10250 [Bacteroidales bacterium]|nr:hypothetical protein [Bacteroidales bacterium]
MNTNDFWEILDNFKEKNPGADYGEIIAHLKSRGFSDVELNGLFPEFGDDTIAPDAAQIYDNAPECEAVPDIGDLFDLPDDIKDELDSNP